MSVYSQAIMITINPSAFCKIYLFLEVAVFANSIHFWKASLPSSWISSFPSCVTMGPSGVFFTTVIQGKLMTLYWLRTFLCSDIPNAQQIQDNLLYTIVVTTATYLRVPWHCQGTTSQFPCISVTKSWQSFSASSIGTKITWSREPKSRRMH